MTIVPSLMTLVVASLAICLSVNATEEMVKVAATGLAILFALLSLIFSPWFIKAFLVLAAALYSNRLQGLKLQ
jgi:hypothetical protein